MSKSRKKNPCGLNAGCTSQKRGKQVSHRAFRKRERQLIHMSKFDCLPLRQIELVSPWDLGGDGKGKWFNLFYDDYEYYLKLMRK